MTEIEAARWIEYLFEEKRYGEIQSFLLEITMNSNFTIAVLSQEQMITLKVIHLMSSFRYSPNLAIANEVLKRYEGKKISLNRPDGYDIGSITMFLRDSDSGRKEVERSIIDRLIKITGGQQIVH